MKKLISFKHWLNEQNDKKEYGCVMLDTHIPNWKEEHLSKIAEEDLYEAKDDEYGYNEQPHITVIYGIHLDETEPNAVISKMGEMNQVSAEINKISIFENEKYDVVKYDVPVSDQLQEYRDMFEEEFPNTQKFPDYHPHITIAYVKSGLGKKYVKTLDEPFELTFDEATYSYFDYEKDSKERETIKLEEE